MVSITPISPFQPPEKVSDAKTSELPMPAREKSLFTKEEGDREKSSSEIKDQITLSPLSKTREAQSETSAEGSKRTATRYDRDIGGIVTIYRRSDGSEIAQVPEASLMDKEGK